MCALVDSGLSICNLLYIVHNCKHELTTIEPLNVLCTTNHDTLEFFLSLVPPSLSIMMMATKPPCMTLASSTRPSGTYYYCTDPTTN